MLTLLKPFVSGRTAFATKLRWVKHCRRCLFLTSWKSRDRREVHEDPTKRTIRIFKEEFESYRTGKKRELFPNEIDILIIGGGIIGSSIAYWLKQRAPESFTLAVVEKDLTYSKSATRLSLGGIRQQFSLPENIELSLFGAEFLRNIKKNLRVLDLEPTDVDFQPQGHLFLASQEDEQQLIESVKLQQALGSKVELIFQKNLKERFPWMNTEGVTLASHGLQNEGSFDPRKLLIAFRRKAMSQGAMYLDAEAVDFAFDEQRSIYLEGSDEPYKTVNYAFVKLPNGEEKVIHFAILIVTAGAASGEFAKLLRIGNGPGILRHPLPIEPRKKHAYVFESLDGPGLSMPALVDYNGLTVRREDLAGNYVTGMISEVTSDNSRNEDLSVDHKYFYEVILPALQQRVPAFKGVEVKSAWAGYYDYNVLDQNPLIGLHPYYGNVYFVTGFGGLGTQMAPGVGRAMMELILDNDYQTINLDRFSLDRFILDEPIHEKYVA